jgi:7,8-dihydroneopterin aldolase/epimerase/oxygenase
MITTLSITGMHFHAFHGCHEDEQKYGGQYTVDVHFQADVEKSMTSDDLQDTIDYVDIHALVSKQMQTASKLIEHITKRILDKIITQFPQMTYCQVKLTKHNPPITGTVDQVSIQLEYTK